MYKIEPPAKRKSEKFANVLHPNLSSLQEGEIGNGQNQTIR